MAAPIDASASASDATQFGLQTGAFSVTGGNSGTKWLPLALVGLAALVVLLWFIKRK